MAKLGQVFNAPHKTAESHPKRITTWIHYSKLRRNKRQYCDAKDQEEIENLADLILADGEVLQNLIVRKYDADEYEIIAGHKRTLACEFLTEERGLKGFEFLPCIVRNESEAKTRLAIISSNAHHEKTQYEIMHEMQELEYLFTHYPEEFADEELRGRMVERIARRTGKGKSVVGDYLSIAKNLGEPGMDAFEKGELNKDAALALSRLPKEKQEELIEQGITRSKEIKRLSNPSKVTNVPKSGTEAFLRNYKKWKIWAKNIQTEETFYRYELPDGSAIVVKHYPYFIEWKQEHAEGEEYYLLKKDYQHFNDCKTNLTLLKEHLKETEKNMERKEIDG